MASTIYLALVQRSALQPVSASFHGRDIFAPVAAYLAAVRFFCEAAGPGAWDADPRIVSIGPITSEALREWGLEPHVEATEHTPDGVVAAVVAAARAR